MGSNSAVPDGPEPFAFGVHKMEAARRAGVPDEVHEAAYIHAKAYEARRDAGRLPGA